MKIVYFHSVYDAEGSSVGAATHIREIVRALTAKGQGVNVHGVNPYAGPEQADRSGFRTWFKRRLSRTLNQVHALLRNARTANRAWQVVGKERPDVILDRYSLLDVSLAAVARIRKVPFVLEMNAPASYEAECFLGNLSLPVLPRFAEWLNLRLADGVIVVSKVLKKYYMDWGISGDKITVVMNGARIDLFKPMKPSVRLVAEHGLDHKTVIGFIGSFHVWHGMEGLIRLVKDTLDRYPDVVFFFIGKGPKKDSLEKRLAEEVDCGRVVFKGYVPYHRIPEILNVMDIVLAPYPKLDFFYYSPIKLFEYMAAGKAVVSTRIGQIAEIITHGQDGMLFDPDDEGMLHQTVHRLIENPELRRRLGRQARHRIEQMCTWDHSADKVIRVLKDAVQSRTDAGNHKPRRESS